MNDEILLLFLGSKDIEKVRTPEGCTSGKTAFLRTKLSTTYFTENLSFSAVVLIKVRLRGITAWVFTVIIDVTEGTSFDKLYGFTIMPLDVRNVITIVPYFVIKNIWEFVDFKLLVFWKWESSKVHCLSGINLHIKFKSQQFCW